MPVLTLAVAEYAASTRIDDPRFRNMRARITVGVAPDLQRDQPDGRGAKVDITVTSGVGFTHRVDWPRGHSRRGGVTWEYLSAKWHDALPGRDVDGLQLARHLDDLEDSGVPAEAFGL